MRILSLVAVLGASKLVHGAPPQQIPFNRVATEPTGAISLDKSNINASGDESFTIFKHDEIPTHRIRAIEPRGFCDSTVKQWSGYLDTPNDRHMYFWFFESRSDPVNDPVLLWLNGGPGCSSFTGLVMELGPCRVTQPGKDGHVEVAENPWSWNNNASIIFLDQPVGVGYSYYDKGDKGVWTTEAAAKDVYALLQIWFSAFERDFGTNAFHIAGESFAGRYIPVFADYIVQKNNERSQRLQLAEERANKLKHINLSSVLIGNGFTHPYIQYSSYYTAVCTNETGYGPYVSPEGCAKMAATLPRCQALLKKCAENLDDAITCLSASTYCEKTQTEPFYALGRNAYDMEKFGDYDEEEWMATWLNQKDTMHRLGVDKASHGRVKGHTGCDPTVGFKFASTGDGAHPSYQHVASLLENGVSALLYSGARDFICNAKGNERWLEELEWSGQEGYQNTSLKPWHSKSGKKQVEAGGFKTFGNLTFATVAEASHFVPYSKPEESLSMANAWLHHGPQAFVDLLA
ncbi:peptidase S10, serine carboxypeptidase [Cystobasidium minutum MCA 4210]|uniref:peptidase S10, serine carboxypeptidase n=1 Tax=Cystobasidium minutum MCA 4210 TaxID=1397322 RepID=UPI0034CFEC28|eukprot:jgi/Rhomi1/159481/estExt_Genewise1Plus.C_3_t20234